MTPAISVLLDWTRFGLALMVAGGHLTLGRFQEGWPDLTHGAFIAVGGFFLLSGYTIRLVTRNTLDSAAVQRYFVDRAARLLSISLPALAFTAACDAVANVMAPEWYLTHWKPPTDDLALRVASNALLLSQPYGLDISPFSNEPFWSLSYEAGFYVLWGLWLLVRATGRGKWMLLVAALIYGPNILFLFPLWLLGARLYDQVVALRTPAAAWRMSALFLVLFVAVTLLLRGRWLQVVASLHSIIDGFFAALHLSRGRVAVSYVLGALGLYGLLSIALPVLVALQRPLEPSPSLVGWSRRLGEATFPLYLIHYPIYVLAFASELIDRKSAPQKLLLLAAVVVLAVQVAPLGNALKIRLRQLGSPGRALQRGP